VASVGVDDVRDVVNVRSAEVPDATALKMIKRAEVTLELETSGEIDYNTISVLNNFKPCKVVRPAFFLRRVLAVSGVTGQAAECLRCELSL